MAVDFREEGVPLIRLAGLKRGANLLEGCNHLDPAKVKQKWGQFRLRAGDVLLSTSASLGEVATVTGDGEGAIPYTGIISFRPRDERIDPEFIRYMLITGSFKAQIEAMGVGSVMKHFGPSHLRAMTVNFPTVREQRAIAEVLGAFDDKIAANDRTAKTLLELSDSHFLAGVQSDVTRATIGELADRGTLEFGDGYRTKRSEHGQPGLRILRAGDVRDFQVRPCGEDFVSAEFSRQVGAKASRPGDVIMTTKGTVGRTAVVPPGIEPVVYSPQICYFRVRDHERLDIGYLAAWFRSADLENQTASLMYKSDMAPYINLRDIRSLSVPLPGRDEQSRQGPTQRALLAWFDACCAENERLARTRDELLPLLMSGKVDVRSAEDVVGNVV